jgi:hypothetical protein
MEKSELSDSACLQFEMEVDDDVLKMIMRVIVNCDEVENGEV